MIVPFRCSMIVWLIAKPSPVETFENTVYLIFVNSATCVFHENGNLIVILLVTKCDCSFGGELDSIVDQVVNDLF